MSQTICLYIYIERQRDRDREKEIVTSLHKKAVFLSTFGRVTNSSGQVYHWVLIARVTNQSAIFSVVIALVNLHMTSQNLCDRIDKSYR